MQLVLGSASPYKKQLIAQLNIPFETADPNIDERQFLQPTVEQTVRVLAELKAKALLPQYSGTDSVIITADVAGELDGKFLGKPASRQDAIDTILSYSGREMYIWTGTCVADVRTGALHTDVRKATLKYTTLTQNQVVKYVDEKNPLDKGGSIAIEEIEDRGFLEAVKGERAAIIGLSLEFIKLQLRAC
jgi:MAF protein